MAYPTTPISFTTKTPPDALVPAHVNDLQTEVTAIEQGLLTGFVHDLLPTADSTRAIGSSGLRWRIHGSQLLDGTVPSTALANVNGAQIVPGSIPSTTLSTSGTPGAGTYLSGSGGWTTPAGNAKTEYGIVTNASTQTSLAGDWLGLTWDTDEALSTSAMHSTSANSSRLLVVSTGIWQVGAMFDVEIGAGASAIRILQNDLTVVAAGDIGGGALLPNLTGIAMASGQARCSSASDYFVVAVYTSSAVQVPRKTFVPASRFWISKVST